MHVAREGVQDDVESGLRYVGVVGCGLLWRGDCGAIARGAEALHGVSVKVRRQLQ